MRMFRVFIAAAFLTLVALPASAGIVNPTSVNGTANQIVCSPNYGRAVCLLANPLTTPGPVTITGGTLAGGSSPALTINQTWNNGSTVFTGIYGNVTDTASASTSILADLNVGGVSRFRVFKNGNLTIGGSYTASASGYYTWAGRTALLSPADGVLNLQNNAGTINLFLTAPASNVFQIGGADAASPVAQTIQFQNASGTNVAAVNATTIAPLATGNATNGDLIFQTGVKTTSGTAAGTKTTALTIKGETQQAIVAKAAGLVLSTSSSPLSGDACTTGAITWDASYGYICTASGAWKRFPITGGY